jgi:hypothetical protein
MSPEFIEKWEHILEDVEKNKIPVEFIKKLIIKLQGKKQQTINIQKFLQQGLDPDQIEDAVSRKLDELDDMIVSVEFVLNVQSIADAVQPETDRLLNKQIANELNTILKSDNQEDYLEDLTNKKDYIDVSLLNNYSIGNKPNINYDEFNILFDSLNNKDQYFFTLFLKLFNDMFLTSVRFTAAHRC